MTSSIAFKVLLAALILAHSTCGQWLLDEDEALAPAPTPGPEITIPTVPAPAPSVTPPPYYAGAPNQKACQGRIYDGYLSACTIKTTKLFEDGLDGSPAQFPTVDGKFEFGADADGDAQTDYLIMQPLAIEVDSSTDFDVADVCHDIALLLPQSMPMAAPVPPEWSCDDDVLTMSPISSLLAFAQQTEIDITTDDVVRAFSLPETTRLILKDYFKAALLEEQGAQMVLNSEIAVKTTVYLGAWAIMTRDPSLQMNDVYTTLYQAMARQILAYLNNSTAPAPAPAPAPAQLPVSSSSSSSTRRRLQTTTPSSIFTATTQSTEDSFLGNYNSLVAAFEAAYAQLYNNNLPGNAFTEEEATAMIAVMSNLNSIILSMTSVTNTQKAALVAQTTLANMITEYLESGDLAAFQDGTVLEEVRAMIEGQELPGVLNPDDGDGDDDGDDDDDDNDGSGNGNDDDHLALGLGLGLGLGLPLVAVLTFVVYQKVKSGKNKGEAF